MKHYETARVPKKVLQYMRCDHCGKTENADKGQEPPGWHEFSVYHSDWGNDSVDSHVEHLVCSWSCYLAVVQEAFADYSPLRDGMEPTLMIDGKDWQFWSTKFVVEEVPS